MLFKKYLWPILCLTAYSGKPQRPNKDIGHEYCAVCTVEPKELLLSV